MLVLSVVWLATGALLHNVGQTATSAPSAGGKPWPCGTLQQWQNEKLQAGSLKHYRKGVVYYSSGLNKKSHRQRKKMFC